MKKRVLAIVICIATLCICLTSCVNEEIKFIPQRDMSFNYNNVSAGGVDYWLDNNGFYYCNGVTLRAVGVDGMDHLIGDIFNSVGFVDAIQRHGDKLYYISSRPVDVSETRVLWYEHIVEYDMTLRKETLVIPLESEDRFLAEYKFYIVDGYCWYLSEGDDISRVELKEGARFEVVEKNIFALGAYGESIRYIARNEFTYTIYEIDGETNTLGSFELVTYPGEVIYDCVNFTENKVILTYSGEEYAFVVYDLEDETLTMIASNEGCEGIAFEEYMFIFESTETYDEENYCYEYHIDIYRYHLESGENALIYSADENAGRFFVTSDTEVYLVIDGDRNNIRCVSADGKAESIVEKSGFYNVLDNFF